MMGFEPESSDDGRDNTLATVPQTDVPTNNFI